MNMMAIYELPFRQAFLIFIMFSVVGWISEVLYVGIFHEHKFVNRGFLHGPLCPVYGFGGVRVVGEDLTIAPRLPKAWRSLCFRLVWRGQPLSVSVCGSSLRVENRGAAPVRLLLYGRPAEILPGAAVSASPA